MAVTVKGEKGAHDEDAKNLRDGARRLQQPVLITTLKRKRRRLKLKRVTLKVIGSINTGVVGAKGARG